MPDSKIEIKVTTDVDQQDVHIDSMSIDAAKSFSIILDSLVRIVENTPGCENAKIKVIDGSAAAVIEAPTDTIQMLYQGFEDTRMHKCENREVVSSYSSFQKLFKANGLGYTADFYIDLERISILNTIKDSRQFRTKSQKTVSDTSIKFFQTQLIEVGGKYPNIHFLGENEEKITASCSQNDAIRAKEFLYTDIKLSVWKTEKEGKRAVYECCDIYRNAQAFEEISSFIESIEEKSDIDLLMDLHKEIKSRLLIGDAISLRRIARIMRIYSHDSTDLNKLKTILLVTKSFKEREEIAQHWQWLNKLYNKSYKKL